jgi:hypothetical protein
LGDAGEGLVDAEDRMQERLAERQQQLDRKKGKPRTAEEVERERKLNTLQMSRKELERQAAATTHPLRQEQIRLAIADIDRRIAEA